MKRAVIAIAALAAAAGGACEVFNESCPITTPEVWGKGLSVDLDIREEYVRQCEAPVGNFLADGLRMYPYEIFYEGDPIQVQVGLINAGAIRDEVVCGAAGSRRERIPQGPITDQDIYQLLPFYEDSVVVVRMKGSQLERVLERGVSSLTLPGDQGQEGHFLQVSGRRGIQIEVDCNGQPQTLSSDGKAIETPGERIRSICLGSDPCTPIEPSGTYHVAALDYMVGTDDQGVPNDGFVGFHYQAPDEDFAPEVLQTYLPVIDVVREWLVGYEAGIRAEYPEEQAAAILQAGYPAVEGRLQYQNCEELAGVCGPAGD